ncbi:hypothetical protein EV122DRAFT_282973 [Schizophyllum commune]
MVIEYQSAYERVLETSFYRPRGPAIRVDADASGVDGASGATRKGDSRVDSDGPRADEGHVALPVLVADAFKVETSRPSLEEWLGKQEEPDASGMRVALNGEAEGANDD